MNNVEILKQADNWMISKYFVTVNKINHNYTWALNHNFKNQYGMQLIISQEKLVTEKNDNIGCFKGSSR